MKLLLDAALKNRSHLPLAIFAVFSLLFLSVADQMERFSLGIIANTGADFFTMFSDKTTEGKMNSNQITLKQVQKKWKKIDHNNTGVITKKDAQLYLSKKKTKNPVKHIIHKFCSQFDLDKNFTVIILALIIVAIFKAIILFFSRYAVRKLSIKVTKDLKLQYFEHIQSLPLSFYQQHNLGSLSARAVGDAGQIASSINSCIINYCQTPFIIVSSLYFCFYLSWQLSLVIFIALPLIIFPVIFLTKKVKKVARQMQRNQESFTSVLLDFLSGIQTVKIFAMEKFSLKKFKEQNNRMAHLEGKSAKYSLLTRPILHTITTICLAAVLIIGLHVLNMSIAQLIVFCALLHLFYEPVKKFAEENANIQRGVVAAERMFEVMHLKPNIQDIDGAKELTTFNDAIVFENVSFKYNQEWVLKDVSFTVKKGQTVAIVGPTGAGKSTIVHLIPRLYEVQEGRILIDGQTIDTFTQKSLREKIAFVPQKSFLFLDSIYENIRFGRDFSFEEVVAAAKRAHAHEFIVEIAEQYNHLLADAGKNLSGGQQQRLTIARALIKNAPILILDEATSSLDAISENKIKMAIQEQKGKMTQIIIAHRLSTITDADKIIFLDRGKKIAEGTKNQLLESSEHFRDMWKHFHRSQHEEKVSTVTKS